MAVKIETITITTAERAAQALHYVWPADEKERRALLQMIIESGNVGALLSILPLLGPHQAEKAIMRNLSRIRIDEAFLALREMRPCKKYRKIRSSLVGKILRNPIQRWIRDIESFQNSPELMIPFLAEEVDEMVGVVKRSRSPEFASRLCALTHYDSSSLLNQKQQEQLKSLAVQYKHSHA